MGGGEDFARWVRITFSICISTDLTCISTTHSARARLGRGRGQREAQQRERVEVLAAKDRERQAQFTASLGVDLSKGKSRAEVYEYMYSIVYISLYVDHNICTCIYMYIGPIKIQPRRE